MSCRMYLALKMSNSSGGLVVSVVRVIFFIVGGNGFGESRVSDELSCPGKLSLEYSDLFVRGSWIVLLSHPAEGAGCEISGEGGTSVGSSHPDEVECRSDRMAAVRHPGGISAEKNFGCDISGWNELCHASQGEPSAWPREREPRDTF